jgi:ribosomal protein L7Ae-like RNA K-turn-binding protein
VDGSDPLGLIEKALLEKLKSLLRAIEKAQRKDHADRSQGIKNDGTPGKEAIGKIGTNHTQGRFERNKMKTEVLAEDIDSLDGVAHYHSAPYTKVKGG